MIAASALPTVNAVAAVLAVIAAAVAIMYARMTVHEARATSHELAGTREATAATLNEQRATTEALTAAHQAEMGERERALQSELVVQRLTQLERVSELVLEVIDAARDEYVNPPQMLGPQMTATRVPQLLLRLQGAAVIAYGLGMPQLVATDELARSYRGRAAPLSVIGEGTRALSEIETLARNHERLNLPPTQSDGTGRVDRLSHARCSSRSMLAGVLYRGPVIRF